MVSSVPSEEYAIRHILIERVRNREREGPLQKIAALFTRP